MIQIGFIFVPLSPSLSISLSLSLSLLSLSLSLFLSLSPLSLPPSLQWSGRQPPPCIDVLPVSHHLKHILTQVYNRSVKKPEELNQYEPFSPEVST